MARHGGKPAAAAGSRRPGSGSGPTRIAVHRQCPSTKGDSAAAGSQQTVVLASRKARPVMDHEEPLSGTRLTNTRLRTPRAAAVAGILFSLLITLVLVLILISTPSDPAAPGAWLSNSARRGTVALALNLVPFAGITFLWFIGVVRDRLGHLEDRFFASVFLGSGLLFVAMLFAGAAFSGGLLAEAAKSAAAPGPDTLAVGRQITSLLLRLYAMRMAAVFTLSTATITLR